uniref:Uncharacterized protein n=1 Tax=Biomphalaria glabrata TaxID=6526 RepID=A0A2C9LXU0_BIOGL
MAMDPSPTPPRRFSHWKTSKRTFTFGKLINNKLKGSKSPKSNKSENSSLIKSLQKIRESSVNEEKDDGKFMLNDSPKKKSSTLNSSDFEKKKLRSNTKNLSDRDDSTEEISVDKENKDRSQKKHFSDKKKKNKKEKIKKGLDLSVKSTSKRKHSTENVNSSVGHTQEQSKVLLTKQSSHDHIPQSSESEAHLETSQPKRSKKSKDVVQRSHETLGNSNNTISENDSQNFTRQEKNKNSSRELKRLSGLLNSSSNEILEESNGRPPGLRNRSLLMSSEAMRDKRQYPIHFYYSSKKMGNLSNTSGNSSNSANASQKSDSSNSKKKNASKSYLTRPLKEFRPVVDSSNSHSSLHHSEQSLVERLGVDKISPDVDKSKSKNSKKTSLKSSVSVSDDDSINEFEEHNSNALNQSESLKKQKLSKKISQSTKDVKIAQDKPNHNSEIVRVKQNMKRKPEATSQLHLANQQSSVKKMKLGRNNQDDRKKNNDSFKNVQSSVHTYPPPISIPSLQKNSETSKSRPNGLRNNSLLTSPASKQYPISYYYSSKHPTDANCSIENEYSPPKKRVKSSTCIRDDVNDSDTASQQSPEVPAGQKKSSVKPSSLKAGKVSVSDSVFLTNSLSRQHSKERDTTEPTIKSPEPLPAGTKKKIASRKRSSSQATINSVMIKSQENSINSTVLNSQKTQRRRNLIKDLATIEENVSPQAKKKDKLRSVQMRCEEGTSRPGSDVTAFDVLLENIESIEQKLMEDELDMNNQRIVTKVMNDLKHQLEQLLMKRLDLKSIERELRKTKARCSQLKEDISKKQKDNMELSSQVQALQNKDLDLLLVSGWMTDYTKLMETLDNQLG